MQRKKDWTQNAPLGHSSSEGCWSQPPYQMSKSTKTAELPEPTAENRSLKTPTQRAHQIWNKQHQTDSHFYLSTLMCDESSCSLLTHSLFCPQQEINSVKVYLTLRGWCSSSGAWWVLEEELLDSPLTWTCQGAAWRSGSLWPGWGGGSGSGGTRAGTDACLYLPPEEDESQTAMRPHTFTAVSKC